MRVSIICFSQTGNTRKVGEAMADAFEAEGHDICYIPLKRAQSGDFSTADIIGVGAPCFESQAPAPVRALLKKVPDLTGKRAFVFATSGGGPGRVLYDLARPLMDAGADVAGGFLCRGTCYYPVPCLVNRFPGRPDKHDLEDAGRFARAVLAHVKSGRKGPVPGTRPDTVKHGFGFYHILAIMLKAPLVRTIMPEPALDPEKCDECGWCFHACPTNSIVLNPVPEIMPTCIRCYRCLSGCRKKALSVKWGASNFIVWTAYNQTFERWLGDIRADEKVY